MKSSRLLSGSLSVLVLGGMWVIPTQVHALPMYSPISFYNYSLVDTATTSVGTKSQTLSGATPQSGTVTESNPTLSGTPRSSVSATVNPQEIPMANPPAVFSNAHPNISIAPSISIQQTVTALPFAPPSASAISKLSADFTGTGNLATFYVNYFAGGIHNNYGIGDFDDAFNSNLTLTVTNVTAKNTQIASLNVMGNANEGGSAFVTSSGFILNRYTNSFPSTGPLLLDFATQSNDLYNISVDLSSFIYSSRGNGGGTGLTSFDLIANTPEPSTWLLFGTGMALMGMIGLRSRKGLLTRA